MNYAPMGRSFRVNHKPVCAMPSPTIHLISANFISDISCRNPAPILSSLASKRSSIDTNLASKRSSIAENLTSTPANLASMPANLASTPANLASTSLRRDSYWAFMSLRRPPISRCKSSLVASKSSLVASAFRLTSKISDKTSDSASACADGTPTDLSRLATLSVSNLNTGSAIERFSLPRILSQHPLTSSDEAAYSVLNAETSAGWLTSPCTLGANEPRQSGYWKRLFLCQTSGITPLAGRMGEPQGSPVPRVRSCHPVRSATSLTREVAINKPHSWSHAMTSPAQGTPVPSVFQFDSQEVRI